MAPNILYTILFIVNCNECLSVEFIRQTSVPYKRIGMHFDLINSNNRPTSSGQRLRDQCSGLRFISIVKCVHFNDSAQSRVRQYVFYVFFQMSTIPVFTFFSTDVSKSLLAIVQFSILRNQFTIRFGFTVNLFIICQLLSVLFATVNKLFMAMNSL